MVYNRIHRERGVGMSTAARLKVHGNWPEWRPSVEVREYPIVPTEVYGVSPLISYWPQRG